MKFGTPLTVEETKQVELSILTRFDAFCREHSLRYYLAYGTLIGAVRHKGFIPWDDDIDIQMPREDYVKLLSIYPKDGTLRLIAPTDPDAEHTFAKLVDTETVKVEGGHKYKNDADYRGIDIDIFPLDGQPSDGEEYRKWYHKLRKVYRKIWMRELELTGDLKLSFKLAIVCFKAIRVFIPKREKLLERAAALHAMYPYDSSEYVGCIESYFNGIGNRNPKSAYGDTVLLDFEDKKFPAPVGYHDILTNMYGDYMQLPPEDKRESHNVTVRKCRTL